MNRLLLFCEEDDAHTSLAEFLQELEWAYELAHHRIGAGKDRGLGFFMGGRGRLIQECPHLLLSSQQAIDFGA